MNKIIKTIARPAFLVLVAALFAACSSDPKMIERQEKALDAQARFYDEEAVGWREDGNEGMARHFEKKAYEARKQRDKLDDDFIDILIDIATE